LERKLAEVTAELEQLKVTVTDDNSSNISVAPVLCAPLAENREIVVVTDEISLEVTKQLPPFNMQVMKEVSSRFFATRRELHQDYLRLHSLSKVLRALQIISRQGSRAGCGVQVTSDQVEQTKTALAAAKEQFSAKKEQVKVHAHALKALEKQEKVLLKARKAEKKACKGDKEKRKCKKDRKEKKEKKEKKARRCDSFSAEKLEI